MTLYSRINRRKHKRYNIIISNVSMSDPLTKEKDFAALIENSCISGLCIITENDIKKGQVLQVKQSGLPNVQKVIVRWNKKQEDTCTKAGLEFVK